MTYAFVSFQSPYLCPSEGHRHGVSTQCLINLSKTFLQISPTPNIAQSDLNLCETEYNKYTNTITGCTRNANNSDLRPNRVRTSLFCDSFFNRIVPLWNNISLDIREAKVLFTFKDHLFNYSFNKFIANFDTSRIQTWKTVCPHCRSIDRKNCC